jgi:phosphoserine phosphatase RsbU/P
MARQHSLECMEIWGGSAAAAESVATPGLRATVLSRPFESAEEGGDIHYVTVCGSGRITRAILADVAGHGAQVSAVARSLRELLRKNINFPSQKRLVRALNRQFSEMNSVAIFATAAVVTYLTYRDTLTFCNAGHPRPLFYSAGKKSWRLLGPDDHDSDADGGGNIPLGIDPAVPYVQFAVRAKPGDVAILYTDYLIEARDAAGEALGEEGILRLAADLPADNPEQAAQQLLARVDSYRGDVPPDDDASLLVLSRTADKSINWNPAARLKVWAKALHLLPV